MKDTIYNEMQVREIIQPVKEEVESNSPSGINYLEFLKEHPNPEINVVALNYEGDEMEFISDLMACPDFEHLMEKG